jgi:tryptophan synthase alpha chain
MYYNLIYQYDTEKFFADFHKAGVNSVLVADMCIDDADEVVGPATKAGLDTVFMVTPNTEPERMKLITSKTTGFIYTVSLLGVTGTRDKLSDSVEGLVKKLKKLTDVPVCVGFGISSPEHAAEVAKAGADGVIIGSKIVGIIEENLKSPKNCVNKITAFIKQVKISVTKQNK